MCQQHVYVSLGETKGKMERQKESPLTRIAPPGMTCRASEGGLLF
jgi:hypothetical protein